MDLRQALLVGTTWRIRRIDPVASAVVAAEFVPDSDADPTVRFGLRLGKLNPCENGPLRPSAGVTAARCVGDCPLDPAPTLAAFSATCKFHRNATFAATVAATFVATVDENVSINTRVRTAHCSNVLSAVKVERKESDQRRHYE